MSNRDPYSDSLNSSLTKSITHLRRPGEPTPKKINQRQTPLGPASNQGPAGLG
jgi:hypothetical protein